MIMDSRIAAELLYESEATLRMVDTVLDDLHLAELEVELEPQPRGLWAVQSDDRNAGDYHAPTEFCVRGYWQVHELLDCLRQAREMIAPSRQQTELRLDESAGNDRLDEVLSMVDALDSLEDPAEDRGRLVGELRTAIRSLLDGSGTRPNDDLPIRSALSLLADAEVRLTRLGHLFDGGDRAA